MDAIQQRLRALSDRVSSAVVGTNRRDESFQHLASEPLVAGAVPYGLEDVATRSRVSDRVQPSGGGRPVPAAAAHAPAERVGGHISGA